MMPKIHIIVSAILAAILFPFISWNAIIVFFAGFIFDIDHYLYDAIKYKEWNFWKVYKEHIRIVEGDLSRDPKAYFLHIFHTAEITLLVLIVSFYHNIFLYILFGLLLHLSLDLIESVKSSLFSLRSYSIIQYFLKKNKIFAITNILNSTKMCSDGIVELIDRKVVKIKC